jgi:phospholipase C
MNVDARGPRRTPTVHRPGTVRSNGVDGSAGSVMGVRYKRAYGHVRPVVFVAVVAVVALVLAGYPARTLHVTAEAGAAATGIHKIKHVVVIMQENRSFDSYFGTFPGADGIPMNNGVPTVCNPDPTNHTCVAPFVDHYDVTQAGPHAASSALADLDGGKLDGFVATVAKIHQVCNDNDLQDPNCQDGPNNSTDVMGYHTESDIPNYWAYATNFVLQDHMFEPVISWSLPAHLFMVSEWAAVCKTHNPNSCTNDLADPAPRPGAPAPVYAWTDLTYLLHKNHVSWGYYISDKYGGVDCPSGAMSCPPILKVTATPEMWNPLPYFDTVRTDHQVGNIQSLSKFRAAAKAGTLPAVSWVVPSGHDSEHPPSTTSVGQSYVTTLINAVMDGPDWSSTAIFLAWDDWGGFYDNVVPPRVDRDGYGLRVPGLVISPYAKRGYVDHQILSFDAYDKFIEDDFLNSQRLDPTTDGRPDPRLAVPENASVLGDLVNDFDFSQAPRPPMLLPDHPKTTLANRPPFQPTFVSAHKNTIAGQVTVTWRAPVSNGGMPVTLYEVVPYLGSVAQKPRVYPASVLSGNVNGLTKGKTYTFKVAAVNDIGVGITSTSTTTITI